MCILFFSVFSLYFPCLKKGVLGVLLYRGKSGEKKGKEGGLLIMDMCPVYVILETSIRSIQR